MEFNLLIGIFGMVLLLAGLFLLLAHKINPHSRTYLLLNIFGGAILFYYSFNLGSIPFMLLEAVWTIIPLYNLILGGK